MDLFLSWSGHRSKAVAEALRQWLSQVIQAVDPWISSDIDKGARWSPEISDKLEKSKVGIICLTRDNLSSPWILFESGALSKTKDAFVCTFLLDLSPADVGQPLGQFQHTSLEKEDFRRLVGTINRTVQNGGERFLPDQVLDSVFDTYWSKLEQDLATIRSSTDGEVMKPRKDREILEDILESVRAQERRLVGLESVLFPLEGEMLLRWLSKERIRKDIRRNPLGGPITKDELDDMITRMKKIRPGQDTSSIDDTEEEN